MMNGVVQITTDLYREMVIAYASAKSLERYVKSARNDVSRKKIAAILGFELEGVNKNADV